MLSKKTVMDAPAPSRPSLQRILVAVEFSGDSEGALAYAGELAARLGASLSLVHVVEPNLLTEAPDALPASVKASDGDRLAEAKLDLNTLAERMIGNCRVVETSVRVGIAFFEITEAARALGADLLVIGACGFSATNRSPLGDTVEKVVRHVACPVLVVRGPNREIC